MPVIRVLLSLAGIFLYDDDDDNDDNDEDGDDGVHCAGLFLPRKA